jgi:hypothetical protein
MIARLMPPRTLLIWLNDRDFCYGAGCSLLSGTILNPPVLARLLMGLLETVLGAIHEC